MASKAITGLGRERTEAEGSVGYVAIDGIATRRGQANPFSSTATGTKCTYLEASQLPPALIHQHKHLHLADLRHRYHRRNLIALHHCHGRTIFLTEQSRFITMEGIDENENQEKSRRRHGCLRIVSEKRLSSEAGGNWKSR